MCLFFYDHVMYHYKVPKDYKLAAFALYYLKEQKNITGFESGCGTCAQNSRSRVGHIL